MDNAATLAFFQNFYTEASLYVVSEPTAALQPADASAAAPAPLVSAVVPQPTGQPAAPPAMAKPAPAPLPPMPPAVAPVIAATPASVSPHPAPAPAPVVTAAAPVAPAVTPDSAMAGHAAVTLTLAPLPAAPAAPPSQPGRVQPTPTQSPVAHIPFSTLGSNFGGLVILVRLPEAQFRKLPRNVFLNNLLKALRLIMEDVVLVNVEHDSYPVALCSLRQHLGARQFLAFGKNLLDVAVYTTQPYEPVLLYGDTAFLGASEIEMLEYDAGRKKKLWQSVQRMFGV
ncbi:hypothetical protein D0N36_03005 [Hymenobacter lapidiphilus]|uniref:hypothetical protein n=1 Tax=Hymenobacter sp. CCM 8763 TaxID=2303334 RepID=UPI000E3556EF|nr:hypothetical protein [Hymenobacter sp. CCM 8763]RFP66684.1 hypothetical protein D0N36_03005 [Hymenobacter sp. CCM 8763]